jgi:hypothetical protein
MKVICGGLRREYFDIITTPGRISTWKGIRLSRKKSNLDHWVRSSLFLKSVAYIIAIDGPHKLGELPFS